MMFGGGKKGGGKGGMDDVLKAARRASAAKVLLEAAKPVPKKVDRLAELQKRFDALVGAHTQTEALFATGGGDLPASLPPSRMAPEAAPSLPLPPRSAGGSLCYAIGEQPGRQLERGPRLRLQPSISTPALRRSAEAGQPGCFAYMSSQPQPSCWADEQAARLHRGGPGTSPPGMSMSRGGATAASCGGTNHHGGACGGGTTYGASCSCCGSPTHGRPKSSARRFTYGLSSFDDETVERMLSVDHAATRRPAPAGPRWLLRARRELH